MEDNSNYSFIKGDIYNKGLIDLLISFYKEYAIDFLAEIHEDGAIKEPSILLKSNIEDMDRK